LKKIEPLYYSMTHTLEPIGIIHSPYKQKFAIPRQPGLVKSALGAIEFHTKFADPNSLRGIEQFSHLWLIFQFHQTTEQGWSPMVRPPRLGGNKKLGVFATRSTFRPNNMGLSVVEFVEVTQQAGKLVLVVRGIDLLDGTPVFDIKPYVPYVDALVEARGGFAEAAPPLMAVDFLPMARDALVRFSRVHPELETLITEVLSQDPRPAYHGNTDNNKSYGMHLHDYNIHWRVQNIRCVVESITKI
jgi:tRNA (adenine37-N6)-methyltransferase